MTTDALERTTTVPVTDDGDHDRFAHYYPKWQLDRALLNGVPATALCGKTDIPLRGIDGRTVCPTCKERLEEKEDA